MKGQGGNYNQLINFSIHCIEIVFASVPRKNYPLDLDSKNKNTQVFIWNFIE